jgi:hypothetical protein
VITLPPMVTMLVVCLVCVVLGFLAACDLYDHMLASYLHMSPQERSVMRRETLTRLWRTLRG